MKIHKNLKLKFLKTRRVGHTLWVEIHNPYVNFITMDWLEELYYLIKCVEKDDSIKVFILTGGLEDTYIMHFDVKELVQLGPDSIKAGLHKQLRSSILMGFFRSFMSLLMWAMDKSSFFERFILKQTKKLMKRTTALFLWFIMIRTYIAIGKMNKITIAAINGHCNGGATEMSTWFDYKFMIGNQDFVISQPEVLVGIIPGGSSTQKLPRLIGKARALELMLYADVWSPQEAKIYGLITDFYNKKEFNQKVQEFADKVR